MLIEDDRAPGLAVLIFRQKVLQRFLKFLRIGIVDFYDHGIHQRLHPVNFPHLNFLFQFMLDVFYGHDADDAAFPHVGQPVGFQKPGKGLVPGNVAEIDIHVAFQVIFNQDVAIDGLGHGPQHRLEVRLPHGQIDRLGRKLLGLISHQGGELRLFVGRRRKGYGFLPVRGRISAGSLRHRFPFFKNRVFLFAFQVARASDEEHKHQNADCRQPPGFFMFFS
ncbi:MAG: hypothetical protein BWY42_01793 [Candidatus Omnitrophica bacterium ADurb.Bin277]|nr:MAG: hypothetical protein BWY42_01793 [Candidatus Omnitrophica bacterium ADurb.Bin277]